MFKNIETDFHFKIRNKKEMEGTELIIFNGYTLYQLGEKYQFNETDSVSREVQITLESETAAFLDVFVLRKNQTKS